MHGGFFCFQAGKAYLGLKGKLSFMRHFVQSGKTGKGLSQRKAAAEPQQKETTEAVALQPPMLHPATGPLEELAGEPLQPPVTTPFQLKTVSGSVVQRRIYNDESEHATDWNALIVTATGWEVNDECATVIDNIEAKWWDEGYDKKAACTNLRYKVKNEITKKYEADEDGADNLDWGDMEDFLNALAAKGLASCLSIEWLGARGGHNNNTWKVKGLKDDQELMGSIALDAHTRGPGNRNLAPARGDVKRAIRIYNENLNVWISEV